MQTFTLGQKIATIRTALGYNQTQLAAIAGVSRVSLNYIEVGRTKPTQETIDKIEAALNIQLNSREVEAALIILAGEADNAQRVDTALAVLGCV